MEENSSAGEPAPIRRTFTLNDDSGVKLNQGSKGSSKTIVLIIVLLLILAAAGFFANQTFHPFSASQPVTEATPIPTPEPSPSPEPVLNRAEWSFEVLNGSGATGQAKKVAEKIQALGYTVVKTGNADKSNYEVTQILVKKDLTDKVNIVVADLKDAIRIASVAGELTEGTASARIIIGKDSI